MNKIDIELYKTFCKNFDYNSWGEEYTRNHPPCLENIFQKAKEYEIICELAISSFTDDFKLMFSKGTITLESFYYDPCESLLNQVEETKQKLLNFF